MKNMSFGKLLAIFGGSLVTIMIIAIIVIKVTSAPKVGTVVRQRNPQQQFQQQQPDILAEQLRREQEAADTARASLQKAQATQQAMQQAMQQQTQILVQRLDGMASSISMLEQRIASIENSRRPTSVEIVRPERKPRNDQGKQLEKRAEPLPANADYRVIATVSKRAWVAAGENEDSVTEGDALPPVIKPPVVQAINKDAGTVITSAPR